MQPEARPSAPASAALAGNQLRAAAVPARSADLIRWRILQSGSRSFGAAARLLPAETRRAATTVYAYCRQADDAIDETHDPKGSLADLQTQLDRIYARLPAADLVEGAFCETVQRFEIPRHVPQALLEGFLWDAKGRRYASIGQLEDYCVRVASSVGVMMSHVLGVRDPLVLSRACSLGVAMQLTNIARDVGRDARSGRVYLPLNWLREEGLNADELVRTPRHGEALGRVVRRLLETAQSHYDIADTGISHLPRRIRPAIYAARLIYADIGRAIRRNGYDAISSRAHTSLWRKLWLVAQAFRSLLWSRRPLVAPPDDAVAFLLKGSHGPLPSGATDRCLRE